MAKPKKPKPPKPPKPTPTEKAEAGAGTREVPELEAAVKARAEADRAKQAEALERAAAARNAERKAKAHADLAKRRAEFERKRDETIASESARVTDQFCTELTRHGVTYPDPTRKEAYRRTFAAMMRVRD